MRQIGFWMEMDALGDFDSSAGCLFIPNDVLLSRENCAGKPGKDADVL